MSKTESWKTWAVILIILIVFGLLSAVWPALANVALPLGSGESQTQIPVESEPIVLQLPAALGDQTLTLAPLAAVGILTVVVLGTVVVTGALLGGLYLFLDRQASAALANKEPFVPDNSRLAPLYRLQSRILTAAQERFPVDHSNRSVHPIPSHQMPRWSVISTSLIIIVFVFFAGMVVTRTFFPEGIIEYNDRLLNPATPIVGTLVLLTIAILVWHLRPQKIESVQESDSAAIPWDFIAVLLTGLIMIGLGIGIMVYINTPG